MKNILLNNQEYLIFLAGVMISSGIIKAKNYFNPLFCLLLDKVKSKNIDQKNNDLVLELNLPTDEMHVNSKMPFSVYLRTSDNYVIRAPFDIDVNLEYEKSLATPNSDVLTIKKGNYYAWGTLETHEKVGNTFLRAIQNESNLDTAKSVKISSTLPTSLAINVYPKLINADVKKQLDIFVNVVDSDGNPTITPNDIKLNFFSNDQYSVGDKLDKSIAKKNLSLNPNDKHLLFFGFVRKYKGLDLAIKAMSNKLIIEKNIKLIKRTDRSDIWNEYAGSAIFNVTGTSVTNERFI